MIKNRISIDERRSAGVTIAVTRVLRRQKNTCHTVTFDNGHEFAGHETITSALKTTIYFARPYHFLRARTEREQQRATTAILPQGDGVD